MRRTLDSTVISHIYVNVFCSCSSEEEEEKELEETDETDEGYHMYQVNV